ncbi:hypothetical protein AAFF_G00083860 [Aldrovandia affinis]|uniref:Uncharacterized protein n=1 Tax=Aldrovandia affinis TaxID=143900 RepID=A0AAD7RX67_9TELE|nr:hypothetical protein AAFF_G00083860 [Aldrovandia affinis]
MVENGNILRSLKEQSETHAKKFDTVFNKIDSMQAILAGARKARPALSDGTQLLFFADYSLGTREERQGYRDSREAPAEGIDSF